MPGEVVGRGLQPVIHVDGMDLARPRPRGSQEQGGGVRTAAEGDGRGQRRLEGTQGRGDGQAHAAHPRGRTGEVEAMGHRGIIGGAGGILIYPEKVTSRVP